MKKKIAPWVIAIAVLAPVWLPIAALVGVLAFGSARLWHVYMVIALIAIFSGIGLAGQNTVRTRKTKTRTKRVASK